MGNNVTYDNAIFRYNTAVNGSALFVDGVASLKNIVFYRNQAYTYVLPIIVQNPKTPYGVTVNVTVVIIGGNNIANAIHHVGQLNDISFDNVTYLFNVNGTIMNRTTGADEIHPVDGVENSKNGTLIYRDERENTQSINPIVIYNEDGNIIYNETLISSIYGDVRFSLSGLAPGNYTIKAEHPEDLFYKAIKNETNFEVVGFVDLDVDITTDKNYYGLDEEVEWTISLTNHGPHTDNNCYVNGIKLEDIVGFTPSKGTFDAATGIWKVGKLAKNEVVTLKVKTKTTSLGTVTLTVNAVNSTEDTNISNNVATKTIYIQELPKVVPTKDVNVTNPNYGDKVKYTIVVSNVGKITADVTLTDILDKGLIFTGASGNYEYDSTTRTVTWNIDGLAVGQNLTFYVYATVDAYGVLNNTVTVGDNTVIRNVTVPEITPDKTIDNDSPNFGDKVSYTVTVTNGEFEANNVIVKDVVGNGLTVTDISDNGQYDPITHTITWIVDLAKNEVKTFTVEATVSGYGNISNKVVVGNKTIFKNVDVPEITPKKDVNNTTPNFGENVAYTIVVSNDGISDAKQVVITDTLAKGLKFLGANYNGVYDENTHTVTWTLDIDSGKTVELKVNVTVEDYGVLTNNVTVGNKTSSVNITVPEIIPNKTADIENPNFGDEVTYTVNITNVGKSNAVNVAVRDVLGEGLELISADGGVYNPITRTITWTVNLNSGETKSFKVVAKVIGYGNVTNSLVVGNKTSAVDVDVPEIIPSKDADNKYPNFGDSIDYTITVNNIGKADAKHVVVVDRLDNGLKYVSSSHNGVYDEASHTVTWVVDIAAGSSLDLTVTAVADEYGVLTNIVSVGDKSASVDVNVPEIIPNKTADIENPNFGDNVTYTVTVTNDGNADAKAVVVRDVLGKDLKFVSATGTYTFDEATNTITWTVDVDAGKTETFTVVATVINYGNVTNSLVVGNKTFNKNVTVPEITPDKTVDKENPNFGDNLTYTVTVKNEGNGNANDVIIVDALGKGLEYVSSTGNYDNKTNTITWKVDLASGETKTFTVVAKIVGYTDVTNEVTVGNKTAAVTVDIPEIIPAKDVNNTTPNFGDKVEYTITVNNNANKDAKQVVIVDTLGKGLKFINASHNGKYDESTRTITWIIDLGAGESAVFSVNAAVEAYGNINNTVVVGNKSATKNITVPEIIPGKSVDVENPNFGDTVTYTVVVTNNGVVDAKQVVVKDILDKGLKFVKATGEYTFDEDSHTVTWIIDLAKGESQTFYVTAVAEAYGVLINDVTVGDNTASADVVVPEIIPDKTANITNPNFGDKVDYTVTVTNDGMGDANNVVIVDMLGEGLTFVSASDNGVWDPVKRTVTWIVDLAKGESKVFSVIATVSGYGNVTNSLVVGNKTISVNVTVPEIIPDKTVGIENPNFGDNVTYTVKVTNDGIGDANNVVVKDILGEGLTFVDATGNYTFDEATRTVTWIVDLAKGESRTFYVNAIVSGYGNVTNSLVVGNKTTGVNVTVPEINPDKTANITNPNFGDKVDYTVTVTNDGMGDAKDVVVRDVLGEGLKFVSATGNYSFDEATRTVTWIVDLAKGESKVFSVIATVVGYGNVTNSLVVGNKTAGVNVTVPEIIPDKTANISNPNFGDNVNYIVTVTNDGIGDAKDVVVRDVLGEGLKFVSATGNYSFDEATRTVTWIVDLAKGESKVFSVIATVVGYGNVTNSLVVGNKTAGVNVTVPEINPDKTVDNEIPNFGDNVTYTVTVTNDGIGDANNVVITDVLDKGLKFLNATGNFTYDEKTGIITWIVDLAKGETKTFNVNVTVLGYGVLPNTVAVGNKTAVRNITVPEIITVKEVNSSDIHIGDEITYTITVSNPGKINATNVVIRDILPEGLKFINASNGGVYDPVTGIITWILNITANSTVDLTADVCVNKSGNITNTVNVGNKTSNCTIESGDIVDLEIHIVADKSEIYVGDNVVYTVTVINNGPSDAINTIANILIPNALSILSYNATKGTFDITSGNWSIGNLTNGEKVVLTFVAKALNEGNSTVHVNVTSETFEVIMENNYDNVTVKVLKKAAPIGPDKQVHPDGSSSDNECGKSVNLPNTGNPLVMLLLCILSVIFVGSRKRKL